MALAKMTIEIANKGGPKDGVPQYGQQPTIKVAFNPSHLKFSRSVNWSADKAAHRDVPQLQFTGSNPRTLSIELIFDTYDSDLTHDKKRKVTELTDPIYALTTVEKHGGDHRPPICRLSWGKAGVLFQGVLTQLEQDLTLFTAGGTPVRAKLTCTFTEWRSNQEDQVAQTKESSDVAKVWVVRRGETLASIASQEYADSRYWRTIADANDIDDPLRLEPGRSLVLPTIAQKEIPR